MRIRRAATRRAGSTGDVGTAGGDATGAAPAPLKVVVASMWPSRPTPEFGIFVKRHVGSLRAAGVEVIVVPLTETRSGRLRTATKYLSLMLRITWAARRAEPDLLVAHYLNPTGDVTRMASSLSGVPYVVIAHGTDVRNAVARPDGPYAARTRAIVQGAAGVVAVSEDLATDLLGLVPGVNVDVCNMGVDTRTFLPRAEATELPAAGETLRLLSVGSLTPDKNHAALIRAVALTSDINLVIVGEGATRPALELLIAEHELSNRVALAGRVPPAELASWYGRFHGACLPSLREGYGLAALEALACGCPVLVASGAPVSKLVIDGVTGVIVDAGDVEAMAAALERMRGISHLTASQVADVTSGRSCDDQARAMAGLLRVALLRAAAR